MSATNLAQSPGNLSESLELRRRSERRVRLFAVGAVVVAILATVYYALASYQPVIVQLGAPSAVSPDYQDVPGYYASLASAAKTGTAHGPAYYSPRPGFTFVVGQSIAVNGEFRIKVTNAVSTFWTAPGHEIAYKVADQQAVFRTGGKFVPLKWVTVQAHDWNSPMFGVRFTVPRCANQARNYPAGTVIQTMGIRLTYKFLWFTHTVDIPTLTPAVVVSPHDCGTPAQRLNKS